MKLKKIIFEKKAQVSLEFLLVLGIIIIAAITVGFYLKQTTLKNATLANKVKNKSLSNTD